MIYRSNPDATDIIALLTEAADLADLMAGAVEGWVEPSLVEEGEMATFYIHDGYITTRIRDRVRRALLIPLPETP